MTFKINEQRFLETFTISSSIGATVNGGLHRLALSNQDKEMRDIFVQWLKDANLKVRVDDFGNIYGRREGKIPDAPVVAMGSHLDTQPTGGRFDGVLGVLSALEVIRVLNDHQYVTDFPIEIINFTNEEGARFEPPMLGSGGLAGVFTKDFIYNSKDKEGVTFKEALNEIDFMGDEQNRIKHVKNFVELHIEQGPILEKENKDIGIVSGIQGMSWLHIDVYGVTNHAGPTPIDCRKDALVASSAMIVKVNEVINKFPGLLITVGKIDNYPNVVNVVPGHTAFTLDIRHPDDQVRMKAIETLKTELQTVAESNRVSVAIKTDWDSPAVHFSNEVCASIARASAQHGYSTFSLFSGPGHDAKYMSKLANTGMIFVKSLAGISHNEEELTLEDDLIKGANVLLSTILELANK